MTQSAKEYVRAGLQAVADRHLARIRMEVLTDGSGILPGLPGGPPYVPVPVPDCEMCGKPRGTGTLLDAKPEPTLEGMAPEMWAEFAARYRCPACAESTGLVSA